MYPSFMREGLGKENANHAFNLGSCGSAVVESIDTSDHSHSIDDGLRYDTHLSHTQTLSQPCLYNITYHQDMVYPIAAAAAKLHTLMRLHT